MGISVSSSSVLADPKQMIDSRCLKIPDSSVLLSTDGLLDQSVEFEDGAALSSHSVGHLLKWL